MKAEWNRKLGLPEAPYARRWVLPLPKGYSLRLHNWMHDDDPDAFHDHPTWFITFVLWGGYRDALHMPNLKKTVYDYLRIGSIRFRSAEHLHRVTEVKPNTWTLCLFGNGKRRWSFFMNGRQVKRDKYFVEVGHHHPDGGRVRLRPDGSRVEPST